MLGLAGPLRFALHTLLGASPGCHETGWLSCSPTPRPPMTQSRDVDGATTGGPSAAMCMSIPRNAGPWKQRPETTVPKSRRRGGGDRMLYFVFVWGGEARGGGGGIWKTLSVGEAAPKKLFAQLPSWHDRATRMSPLRGWQEWIAPEDNGMVSPTGRAPQPIP